MQTRKVANHPFTVALLPIQRRLPMLQTNFFPTGGMPPAKISIATRVDEFKIVAIANRRAIDKEVFEEDFVLRLFVIESELERRHPCLRFAGILAGAVPKLEQST